MLTILNEQNFQLTGCTSDEYTVEVGQLLGAQFMLAGSIGKIGSLYAVDLRIIDVEKGSITKSVSYDIQGEIEQVLPEGMSEVARIIMGESLEELSELEAKEKHEEPVQPDKEHLEPYAVGG